MSRSRALRLKPSPTDLRNIFVEASSGQLPLGVMPEASITSRETAKKFFVEVKKQGPGGNAHERAYKHHTVQFYKIPASPVWIGVTTTPM